MAVGPGTCCLALQWVSFSTGIWGGVKSVLNNFCAYAFLRRLFLAIMCKDDVIHETRST